MFLETPRFPTDISYGSVGGPAYNSVVISTSGGHEQVIQYWEYPLHEYDVSYGIRTQVDLYQVIEYFHAMAGQTHSFRYKDHQDFRSGSDQSVGASPTATDELLGVGDNSETDFQLIKNYTKGVINQTRIINKPVSGTVVVSLDDVPQGSGWSIDTTTGLIVFTAAPALGVNVKAGFEFDVPVRFNQNSLPVSWENFQAQSTSIMLFEKRI